MSRLSKTCCQWSLVGSQFVRFNVILLFISLLLTLHSSLLSEVRADELHYNNILIGDRAAGMGGAYTAVADDSSGLYYNPAGVMYSVGSNVSASANAYHVTNTEYKNVLGGNGWKRQSAALLPNFFGIVQPLGKGKVGFSYIVTDSIQEDQDQVFFNIPGTDRYVVNFNKNDNNYNFGPSYAMEINKKFSVGATLYAHYRENEWILNQLINLSGGTNTEWTNEYYETNEWGVKPILGLMWTPADKMSVGLSMSKTTILDTSARYQKTQKAIDGSITRTDIVSHDNRKMPLATTLGIAYFPSDSLLVSGDFRYYSKVSDSTYGDKEATWNAALGTEYYLSPNWALRAGLFTNRANTPDVKEGKSNQFEHVDMYGGSLSITRFTRQSSVTLGGSYSTGSGEAQVLGNSQTQDLEVQTATLFLSASYSY